MGLIHRVRLGRRESIKITTSGAKHLDNMFLTLKRVFELKSSETVFEGVLFSGLGEGAYYISQPGYEKQFEEKLGFEPYAGTLNLRVREEDQEKVRLLEASPFNLIEDSRTAIAASDPPNAFKAKSPTKCKARSSFQSGHTTRAMLWN